MVSNKYYPQLSSEVDTINLPQELSFIQGGINALLNDIYLKDYQFVKSNTGDSLSYYLILKIYKRLGIDIPGTGLSILLNPPHITDPDPYSSDIPTSINIQYEILKYVKDFSLDTFAGNALSFFTLLMDILDLDEVDFADHSIILFTPNNSVNEWVDSINTEYNLLGPNIIPYPVSVVRTDAIREVINSIGLSTVITDSVYEVVYHSLIEDGASEELSFDNINRAFTTFIGPDPIEKVKKLFLPKVNAAFALRPAIEFPRSVLQPVTEPSPGDFVLETNPLIKSRINFNLGEIVFSTEGGIGYDEALGATFDPAYPYAMIGDTEFIIGFTNAKLDISRKTNIPEATADGRPNDFVGVYIQDGTIRFPAFWNHDTVGSTGILKVRNFLIGTGGISGTVSLEAITLGDPSPFIKVAFGGFEVKLNAFSLNFHQNAITGSDIKGTLKIPGFTDAAGADAIINIDVHIESGGEFEVTASTNQTLGPIKFLTIFEFTFKSVSIGRKDGRFFLALSGTLEILDQLGTIGKFLPDKLDIQKLIIWDDGEIEFEGGVLVLPQAMTLKIPPVELSITSVGFGSYEQTYQNALRKYKFFEFSGGININPGGIDARGDGIKFYFTVDGGSPHKFVRIQGIAIDIILPSDSRPEDASLILKGYLAMKDPQPSNPAAGMEYAGGISFTLPKLKMAGSAAMRINPRVPAFIVDLGLEIPNPILLGSTGLGIYGFRGLVGQRYVASKNAIQPPVTEWWQYYKAKVSPEYREGITVSKFEQQPGFSLGAGVSLATAPDSGRVFSSKVFFLLSLPEVFLLQGQGQILKERIGLDSTNDPPFFALIAISKTSVEAAFGVNYKIPDSGSIATVNGILEMGFFFGNSSAWYINIGRDYPESRRISVRLFDIFNAYFYLMLSSSGIRGGAGASYYLKKKFGPLKAELSAFLDVAGRIAFKPKQIGGSIALGGSVALSIFGFGFEISASVSLSAEAPKPFIITGKLKVCIKVLRKKRCAKFKLTWEINTNYDLDEILILDPSKAVKAVNMLTGESYKLFYTNNVPSVGSITDDYLVPMDSYIDIEFLKGVNNGNVQSLFGLNTQTADNKAYVSPQQAKKNRVIHTFTLDDIKIQIWNPSGPGSWSNYDVYIANTPLNDLIALGDFSADLSTLKSGYWQFEHPNLYNKLRILAQSPFEFINQGSGDLNPEDLGITEASILCPPAFIDKTCLTIDSIVHEPVVNTLTLLADTNYTFGDLVFRVSSHSGQLVNGNGNFQPDTIYQNGLGIRDRDKIEIFFPQPMGLTLFYLKTVTSAITARYYKLNILPALDPDGYPQYTYTLVDTQFYNSSYPIVSRVDTNNPADKVVIETGITNPSDLINVYDSLVTPEVHDLPAFLNELIDNGDFTTSINIHPVNQAIYGDVFTNTSLYTSPIDLSTFIQTSVVTTPTTYELTVSDTTGFSKHVRLWTDSFSPINFADIDELQNFAPDTLQTGNVYNFSVVAVMADTSVVNLRGESSYKLLQTYNNLTTFLFEWCYMTTEAFEIMNFPSPENDIHAMIEGLGESIQPVWRPDSYYSIMIKTTDTARAEYESILQSYTNTSYFCFKTRGPIGHFHQNRAEYHQLAQKDREAEFKLASLRNYIDYAKSYPNADGELINSKPLFYGAPMLNLFYVKNYMFEFFHDWGSYQSNQDVSLGLEAIITDPAPDSTQPPINAVIPGWDTNSLLPPTPSVTTLNNVIFNSTPMGGNCFGVGTVLVRGINTPFAIEPLKPLKLYTAIFYSKHRPNPMASLEVSEVHRYVFQTSRYIDFETQINSYQLQTNPDVDAVFRVELNLSSAQLQTAHEILDNSLAMTDTLRSNFAIPYDRLMNGVFKLGDMHPAQTHEFNVITEINSGYILGILIRNPEPLNDPKIPDDVMAGTISLSVNGDDPANYKLLFSKDKRNIFVFNSNYSLQMPTGIYDFTFNYMQWNGSMYDNVTSTFVSIEII